MKDWIGQRLAAHLELFQVWFANSDQVQAFEKAALIMLKAYQEGKKVLICGNGGSAADAQHIAAELSGRFYRDRPGLPAEALHTNTSYLTAVANDYSYEEVFSRLVKAVGKPGDVLLAISTSGNSANVVRAAQEAKSLNLRVVAFTGQSGGRLKSHSDVCLQAPSMDTARIQEIHIFWGHLLCEYIEYHLFR